MRLGIPNASGPGRRTGRGCARLIGRLEPGPSDYESKRIRPAGTSQAGSGCSRQRGRLLSAFLTCRVMAGGMTKGMTSPPKGGDPWSTFRSKSECRSLATRLLARAKREPVRSADVLEVR
jgi:hypothetical protein